MYNKLMNYEYENLISKFNELEWTSFLSFIRGEEGKGYIVKFYPDLICTTDKECRYSNVQLLKVLLKNKKTVLNRCKTCGKKVFGYSQDRSTLKEHKEKKHCNASCRMKDPLVQDIFKQTNIKKYGSEHASQNKDIQEKIKQTNLRKYGVENVYQNKDIQEKIKKTNLERYGVEYASKNNDVKEKIKKTNLERHGVEHTFQSKEIRDKAKETNLRKYGVEYASQNKEIRDKVKQTNLDKFGFEHASQNKDIQEKIKQTNLDKYGVEHAFQAESVKEKSRKTNLRKYGVEYAIQSKEIRDKVKQANLRKHGVENVYQNKDIQEKIKKTNLERYGVEYATQSKEIRDKVKKTNLERHGVEQIMHSDVLKEKLIKIAREKRIKIITKEIEGKYVLLERFINTRLNGKGDIKKVNYSDEQLDGTIYVKYLVKCLKCNREFRDDLYKIPRCPKCYPSNQSVNELELTSFIENLGFKTEKIRIENKEIDIYIPSLKIGFEYNGTYWHSGKFMTKDYHQSKTDLCLKNGIKLYHIWEYNDLDKIKYKIKTILGLNKRIFARKCIVKEISKETSKDFFDLHHLHNYVPGKVKLGLFHENRLVSAIILKESDNNTYEISRFVSESGLTVVGGFSKLLSHFIRIHNPSEIMTYADRDWTPDPSSSGYAKSNFDYLGDSGPILKYQKGSDVYSRQTFMKHKLEKMFPNSYDDNLTSNEILNLNNIYPIYNSGNHKFCLKYQ